MPIATKVFISYSHDSDAHMDRILDLSNRLRAQGIDCLIDQYEQSPAKGWPNWCSDQIEEAIYVLVACTETYLRRFKGNEILGTGKGGTWEGHIITQELYNAQGRNTKFIPVVFSNAENDFIPLTLQSATAYQIPDHFDRLYRRLTDQPFITKPALGNTVAMPAREALPAQPKLERKPDFQTLWQVPYTRNPFFTAREDLLTKLRAALEARKIAALTAFGGMGKTQTALEYAYRHQASYQAFFWVKAESRETLLADLASFAAPLQLASAQAREQALAVAEVQAWFQSNQGWLLILDNADDLGLAREFIPPNPQGHVLLTTRARVLGGLAERLEVDQLSPEEGAQLLLRRAEISHPSPSDQTAARQISQELGGLPLALDQAGAFIEETPSSPTEYLSLYKSERAALLQTRGGSLDHASVAVTFSLSFKQTAGNPATADLIRLCAFLAPEAIPEEIFTLAAQELGDNLAPLVTDPLRYANLLKEATRFSLLDRDPQTRTLDIHRLVQSVLRDALPPEERAIWAERVVRIVTAAFPNPEFENWDLCQRLLPHAQAGADLIQHHQFSFAEAGLLLHQTAFYLKDRGQYAEAEPLYQRSLAFYEKALGPDHPAVALSLNNLAALYSTQGQYEKAEPLYQRSLAIREKALGPNHPDVASSLNNLAALHDTQGHYDKAEPLYQRSLAIREKALGPNHPDVAQSLNNLALLYDNQGQNEKAEPLYQRSLAIQEKALGPDHPDVATSLNNLAALYRAQGQYEKAEPLHQRSLAIREKALGPHHPNVAISLNNLAELYRAQGQYDKAEPLYQRSLAIWEKALGPNHPDVAQSLNNLAELYRTQGQYEKAEPLYQRSLAIREKALGPDHPDVAQSLNNLAALYRTQGQYTKADAIFRRALAICENSLGPNHPNTITVRLNLDANHTT